jgi:hypothetical protein
MPRATLRGSSARKGSTLPEKYSEDLPARRQYSTDQESEDSYARRQYSTERESEDSSARRQYRMRQ